MKTRILSIPAGNTVGVLASLGITPQGDFEVHLTADGDLAFAEDGTGSVVGPAVGSRVVNVHNEDLFVKHTLTPASNRLLGVLVTQQ